jgi:hypothetical protein
MAKKRPRPRGFGKFDELTRKLVQVPREELEQRLAKRKVKKRKQK